MKKPSADLDSIIETILEQFSWTQNTNILAKTH